MSVQQSATSVIKVSGGHAATVDSHLYPALNRYRWYYCKGYAIASIDRRMVRLHRIVIGAIPGQIVDHINRDPLDCRLANLRLCTVKQNSQNRSTVSKYGYRGIKKSRNSFEGRIRIDGRLLHLGCFPTPEQAARAYDAAARHYFGEFANPNFPIEEGVGTP